MLTLQRFLRLCSTRRTTALSALQLKTVSSNQLRLTRGRRVHRVVSSYVDRESTADETDMSVKQRLSHTRVRLRLPFAPEAKPISHKHTARQKIGILVASVLSDKGCPSLLEFLLLRTKLRTQSGCIKAACGAKMICCCAERLGILAQGLQF